MSPLSLASSAFALVASASGLSSRPQSAAVRRAVTATLRLPPAAIVSGAQVRFCVAPAAPLIEQSAQVDAPRLHPPATAGSSSLRSASRASPVPTFSVRIVKATLSPAVAEPPSGVFVTFSSGQRTVMSPGSVALPSFVVETLAAGFEMRPQSSRVGVNVTETERLPVARMSSGPQFRVCCAPASPLMAQLAQSYVPRPQPPTTIGSASLSDEPRAVPVPVFVVTIVKAASSPTVTVPASGVFATPILPHSTLTET